MGKCFQCGKETKNEYAIKAGYATGGIEYTTSSGAMQTRTIVTNYSIKEVITEYICPKCGGKKCLEFNRPWVVTLTIIWLLCVAILIITEIMKNDARWIGWIGPTMFVLTLIVLPGFSLLFIVPFVEGIIDIKSNNDISRSGGGDALSKLYKKELKKRYRKCKIFHEIIFSVKREDLVRSPRKTLINGEEKTLTAYAFHTDLRECKTACYTLKDIAMALKGTEKQFKIKQYDDADTIVLIPDETTDEYEPTQKAKRSVRGITTYINAHYRKNTKRLDGYEIGGEIFYNIVDISKILDMQVLYCDTLKAFLIDTTKSYRNY